MQGTSKPILLALFKDTLIDSLEISEQLLLPAEPHLNLLEPCPLPAIRCETKSNFMQNTTQRYSIKSVKNGGKVFALKTFPSPFLIFDLLFIAPL